MNLCKRFCLVLFVSIIAGGCYEDVAEIKLNPDGSGVIKQKIVLSERLIISSESENESVSASNVPDTTKEALIKKIGTAFKVNSIKQEDTSDGGRIIELEGTFDTPEQFFLSEYCKDQLNLSISSTDDGKAVINCVMSQSGDIKLEIAQMYGLVKGLFIKRAIMIPGDIEKSNGYIGQNNIVTWLTDLRNKEGLEMTKAFVEGNDKGKGFAIFNASELKFSLPLKSNDTPVEPEIAQTDQVPVVNFNPSQLAAKVSWVSVKKKIPTDGSGISNISNLQVGVDLTWDENNCPYSCEKPVLTNIKDDIGNNLVSDSTIYQSQSKISTTEQNRMNKELTAKANSPDNNAKKLKDIEGYIETVIKIEKEKIALDNLQDLVGKPSTGIEILDSLNFKIKSIEGQSIRIEIDGGNNTIVSIAMFKDDGTEIKRSSYAGGQNTFTYSFREDISKVSKCELEVIVSENRVKVPFSLDEISIP